MEITTKQLKQLKSIELDMLKIFISICEKLNLRYYLNGGTLLGAVRHKGFIPWDDDIDVAMPRNDYEVFLKKAKDFLEPKYFVQTFNTDPEFYANFCKIRDSETTFIETSVKNCKINHGVFIDIFPLDLFPQGEHKIFEFKKDFLSTYISQKFFLPELTKKEKTKSLLTRILYCFSTAKKAVKTREKLYKQFDTGEFLANHSGAYGRREIVPIDWYGEGVDLEFEGIIAKAPCEWHKLLTQMYGDYMQLPPIEKRTGHHYVEVIDLENSYTKYSEQKEKK